MATSVLWLRRDLRLHDLPALRAAHEAGDVVPLFVVDPTLLAGAGPARTAALADALAAAQAEYDGAIVIRTGDPAEVVPQVVAEAGAASVHVSGESTPYGRRRGARVQAALGVPTVATGTPYAVSPGRIRTGEGNPYRVFTPFSRAWRDHGWARPEPAPAVRFRSLPSEGLGALPAAGQATDWQARWRDFLDDLERYRTERDRPDLDATSRMSEPLKYGRLHPRTLLADIADHPASGSDGARTLVTELAWREFYADVLWHHPRSAWRDLNRSLERLDYDDPADPAVAPRFAAWVEGRTGCPMVDAGMRQLRATGWMHNRVRMITASFLTKDLHIWWPHGARVFLDLLRDGDIASNNHGWQWVAGTGTDAAPYFRIFNPVTQGEKFDPSGDYVRRWVPELGHLPGRTAHQPWKAPDGHAHGYPHPIVDHAAERREALARYERARAR